MLKLISFALCLLFIGMLTTRCEPDYIKSNNAINFNSDTLFFDTIIAQLGSTTNGQLRLKNSSKQNTDNISLRLVGGAESNFLLNVNGLSDVLFESISLREKDSIFILVQVKPNRNSSFNGIQTITDSIIIESGSYTEKVVLSCPAIFADIKSGEVTDNVWGSNKFILIENDVTIPANHTLTIEPGCRVHFYNQKSLTVEGSLQAIGSCENPIYFRGYRYDDLIETINYNKVPKQWGRIHLKSASSNNKIENAIIINAETGIQIGEPGEIGTMLQLSHTLMVYNGEANLLGYNSEIKLTNCLLANSNQQIVIFGGKIDLMHCTIANYYEWDRSNEVSITLNDIDSLKTNYILGISKIQNSIVYGPYNEELAYPSDNISNHFEISSSIVKSNTASSGFINKNPLFESLKYYDYNFQLMEDSPAINAGTILENNGPLYDLNCVLRDVMPDIGAYEFKKKATL